MLPSFQDTKVDTEHKMIVNAHHLQSSKFTALSPKQKFWSLTGSIIPCSRLPALKSPLNPLSTRTCFVVGMR